MTIKRGLFLFCIAGAILLFWIAKVIPAEYTVKPGDGREKITRAVNAAAGGIKYSPATLLAINPHLARPHPGQKAYFLTKKEYNRAHYWVKWCAVGGKEGFEPYLTDLADFKAGIIRADSVPRFLDYAGYQFGPRGF